MLWIACMKETQSIVAWLGYNTRSLNITFEREMSGNEWGGKVG
jgi:hypothetical protein